MIWYSDAYYLDTMKTFCCMLNRFFENKYTWKGRTITRDVKYDGWKYHYIETVGDVQTYEIAEKSPLSLIKQIAERANSFIY